MISLLLVLVWNVFIMKNIYMQYVRMLWAKQAYTQLFFVNEQAHKFDWVATNSIYRIFL